MKRFIGPITSRALSFSANSLGAIQGVYARKLMNNLSSPADYMNAVHRLRFHLKYIVDKKLNDRRDLDLELDIVDRKITDLRRKLWAQMELVESARQGIS